MQLWLREWTKRPAAPKRRKGDPSRLLESSPNLSRPGCWSSGHCRLACRQRPKHVVSSRSSISMAMPGPAGRRRSGPSDERLGLRAGRYGPDEDRSLLMNREQGSINRFLYLRAPG
jgi:hypothetical protein